MDDDYNYGHFRTGILLAESRAMRPLATITDGWPAIRRGLPQSFIELETAGPGFASSVWLGHQLRGVLAPLAVAGRRCRFIRGSRSPLRPSLWASAPPPWPAGAPRR